MPTIPTGLRPIVADYGYAGPDGVARTEVAGGLPRYGLEWDRGAQQFRVTLVLTALELSVWTTFYHHVVKKGAIAFDMTLDSGYGPQVHSVNIVPGSYNAARTAGGAHTAVSFVVEAEGRAYDMTTADAELLLELYEEYGPQSDALLEQLEQFANVDTLVLGTP